MTQPGHHILGAINLDPVGKDRAVDHQHRQSKPAGGGQLGFGTRAARVLAHHQIDGVVLHEPAIPFDGEGPSVYDKAVNGQGRGLLRLIDEAQEIVVLRLRGKSLHMHTPQRQHDAAGWSGERSHCSVNVANVLPLVTGSGRPGGPGQRNVRYARNPGGLHRMGAHRSGKGVGRIHKMGNAVAVEVIDQPRNPAKAANTDRHRLGLWSFCSASIAEGCRNTLCRKQARKRAGLCRAAQQEDIRHG